MTDCAVQTPTVPLFPVTKGDLSDGAEIIPYHRKLKRRPGRQLILHHTANFSKRLTMNISQYPPITIFTPTLGSSSKLQQEGCFGEARSDPGRLLPGSRAEFQGWLLGRPSRWLAGCTPAAPHSTPTCPAESSRLRPAPAYQRSASKKNSHSQRSE